MSLILKQIFSLLKIIHSETGSFSISFGVALGFILGMSPTLSLQTFAIFFILLFFRIQFSAALISAFFFKFATQWFDPFFHQTGDMILSNEQYKPLFETMYNLPLLPMTHFNNTIVMGSGILSFFLAPFVFLIFYFLLKTYRASIVLRFQNSKFWKLLKSTSLYQWYYKYSQLYG